MAGRGAARRALPAGDQARRRRLPGAHVRRARLRAAHHGQGQWNGVAILSRVGLDDVVANFAGDVEPDPDARIITATCGGVRVSSVYVPNGRSLDDDHYTYKLSLARPARRPPRRRHAIRRRRSSSPGDFNIAPDDRDVTTPRSSSAPRMSAQPERDRLAALEAWGLVDVFRQQHDGDRLYSWWDYRAGDFHQGRGHAHRPHDRARRRSPRGSSGASSTATLARASSRAITHR